MDKRPAYHLRWNVCLDVMHASGSREVEAPIVLRFLHPLNRPSMPQAALATLTCACRLVECVLNMLQCRSPGDAALDALPVIWEICMNYRDVHSRGSSHHVH